MLVMLEIMSVLSQHSNIILDDTADASEERQQPAADGAGARHLRVWGNLVAFVERLDDEMFESLQVGPHQPVGQRRDSGSSPWHQLTSCTRAAECVVCSVIGFASS